MLKVVMLPSVTFDYDNVAVMNGLMEDVEKTSKIYSIEHLQDGTWFKSFSQEQRFFQEWSEMSSELAGRASHKIFGVWRIVNRVELGMKSKT